MIEPNALRRGLPEYVGPRGRHPISEALRFRAATFDTLACGWKGHAWGDFMLDSEAVGLILCTTCGRTPVEALGPLWIVPDRRCERCGISFTPKRRDSLYCSRRCGVIAAKRRARARAHT